MSDDKQMTLYAEDHATNLVSRYNEEFQSYKTSLNLAQKDRRLVAHRSFALTKVFIGAFLALSAISMVLGSNYLANRNQMFNDPVETSRTDSWVFPVYFIAGVFSVSSVLAFKKAIK